LPRVLKSKFQKPLPVFWMLAHKSCVPSFENQRKTNSSDLKSLKTHTHTLTSITHTINSVGCKPAAEQKRYKSCEKWPCWLWAYTCSVRSCIWLLFLLFLSHRRLFVKCCIFSRVILHVTATSVDAVYSYVIACKYVTVCNLIFIAVDWHVNMCCNCFQYNADISYFVFIDQNCVGPISVFTVRSTADISMGAGASSTDNVVSQTMNCSRKNIPIPVCSNLFRYW